MVYYCQATTATQLLHIVMLIGLPVPLPEGLSQVFLIKVSDSLVSWKSKKQTTVSKSSTEVEYRSLVASVAELIWLIRLLK